MPEHPGPMSKPPPFDFAANMKTLDDLVTLQMHPGFKLFLAVMDVELRNLLGTMLAEYDPNKLLKTAGSIGSIQKLQQWVPAQIDAIKQDIEQAKQQLQQTQDQTR